MTEIPRVAEVDLKTLRLVKRWIGYAYRVRYYVGLFDFTVTPDGVWSVEWR